MRRSLCIFSKLTPSELLKVLLFWKRISEMVTRRLSLLWTSILVRPEDLLLGSFRSIFSPAGCFPVRDLRMLQVMVKMMMIVT